jgi:Ulp1 family protease
VGAVGESRKASIPGPDLEISKVTRSLAHLTDSDIERVASPHNMLNDQVINTYLSLLTHHFEADRAVHLPTQFWTSYARHGYERVKKWLPDCWSPDHTPGILMIPINQDLHWFLLSVDFATRRICLYDSMTEFSQIATQAFKVMTIHNIQNHC